MSLKKKRQDDSELVSSGIIDASGNCQIVVLANNVHVQITNGTNPFTAGKNYTFREIVADQHPVSNKPFTNSLKKY